ncbi:hypothetical protein BDV93DRAFT_554934 [Ceratobasidium sp. AG-I]|nr:hypothetical protein BDV93DRAFT_554934 [Ceratobasidium sp. AG-I]
MAPALDQRGAPNGGNAERNRSPPAFLDLANSAARQGANLPDVNSRIEQKRQEHERQRLQQRQLFEEQMRMLEQHQALEEERLMGSSAVATGGPLNPALSLIGGGAMQHHPAIRTLELTLCTTTTSRLHYPTDLRLVAD